MGRFIIGLCGFAGGVLVGIVVVAVAGSHQQKTALIVAQKAQADAQKQVAELEQSLCGAEAAAALWRERYDEAQTEASRLDRQLTTMVQANLKDPAAEEPVTKKPAEWREVARWTLSGGMKTTETFRARGPTCRVRWVADEDVLVTAWVHTVGGDPVGGGQGKGSDESMVYMGWGTYYLELFALGEATVYFEEKVSGGSEPEGQSSPVVTPWPESPPHAPTELWPEEEEEEPKLPVIDGNSQLDLSSGFKLQRGDAGRIVIPSDRQLIIKSKEPGGVIVQLEKQRGNPGTPGPGQRFLLLRFNGRVGRPVRPKGIWVVKSAPGSASRMPGMDPSAGGDKRFAQKGLTVLARLEPIGEQQNGTGPVLEE